MYTYKAMCTRVIDGDTLELNIDLGFHTHTKIRGRLLNVNAPELFSGTDRVNGKLAKEHLETLVLNKPLIINTFKDKKSFDRWIVEVRYVDGGNVNELIEKYCQEILLS
jgi:micrococcal nuclease